MKPKCEPLKWKLLNSIFRKYCSPYSTHFNILFTSRGRRPTCVISVPIPAKQTKTRKHKQHNGSSRQIKQASLLSKSYHTIRRAESFNTLQPRQMKLGRIEKVKTGSMFFFFNDIVCSYRSRHFRCISRRSSSRSWNEKKSYFSHHKS